MLVKIDAYHDGEAWCARGIDEDIFTQGSTYDELLKNVKEAVSLHLEEELQKGRTVEILVMSEMELTGVA
jgi:hypothetical protein